MLEENLRFEKSESKNIGVTKGRIDIYDRATILFGPEWATLSDPALPAALAKKADSCLVYFQKESTCWNRVTRTAVRAVQSCDKCI